MKFVRHNIELNNKFLFDGHDLSNLVLIEKIRRDVMPNKIINSAFIPGKNGRHFQDSSNDVLSIFLNLRIIENSYEEVQERALEIARILDTNEPKKIELRDSEYFNMGIVSQMTELEKFVNTGSCELVFTCYDPSTYGDSKTISLSNNTTFINPFRETYGLITLTTKETEKIKITLNDGKFLELNSEFNSGATLKIDLEKELITLNENIIMDKLTFDSDFFLIASGENTIKLEGITNGTLEYIERM